MFSSLKDHSFTFFVFLYIIMHILNIASAIKNLKVNEIRHFTFGNYYKQIGFSNENSYYSMKSQRKQIYNCLQLN